MSTSLSLNESFLDPALILLRNRGLSPIIHWDCAGVDVTTLDKRLLTFDAGRTTQKAAFRGELFVANSQATPQGTLFIDFFQHDRDGHPKGILVLELETLP